MPAPAARRYGAKADLALSTWVKLARAFSVVDKKATVNIRTYGLTEAQFSALECIGHKGPMTLGELGRRQLVTNGNITLVADNLEKQGLLERRRSSKDRREVVVHLTPKGRRLFERIFPPHANHIARVMSVLSTAEQEQLGALLKKLGLEVTKVQLS